MKNDRQSGRRSRGLPTRALAEAGVMLALSTFLSFIKIWESPQGGAVTLGSMIPVLVFALRWGVRPGFLVGALHGVIQFLVAPFFFHPIQVLLDYPIGFGMLGLAGAYRRYPALGVIIAVAGRLAAHVLAGVVFFTSFAPEGVNPWIYSTIYNGTFLLPELAISLVVVFVLGLLPALRRIDAL